jgi:phosphoglycerate kinase
MKKAKKKGVKIHLPTDYECADKFGEVAKTWFKTNREGINEGWLGLDIGPNSVKANTEVIRRSKTIFWNGP